MAIVKYKKPKVKKASDDQDIILSNRLYVPKKLVPKKAYNAFTYNVGNPCKNCNCSEPVECPSANYETIEMFKEFDGGDYVGFARGDIGKLKKLFDWDKVVDERSRTKMKTPISFIGELRPKQKKTVKKWLKKRYGMIKAPPRSGKTVLLTYLTCKLGFQTLILVHQDELAEQFYNTFMNINDNKIEFTDAPYLEKKYRKTIVGIARTLKDLDEDWPVTIMTYQKFLRHFKKLKKMRDKWGCVWVDEAHMASAQKWSKIVSILNPRIRSGCSATPDRKDGLQVIGNALLGPITVVGTSDQLVCKVKFIQSEHRINPFRMFTTYISRLCADDKRNKLIVDNVCKDADNNRSILITTLRVNHTLKLADMLQKEGYNAEAIVGNTPNRKQILADFKKGKIQILVASRKITQVGLDLPIMDCMYLIMPNFNQHNLEQEVARCRTPKEGKPQPLVRVIVDKDHNIAHASKQAFYKKFKELGFEFDREDRIKAKKGWS